MHQLAQHQEERNLVSIHRSGIDYNVIQGFILASSEELLVLQYVYDFNLDGLMVLRVADITEVRCSATDKFQKSLLVREGLEQQIPFAATFDLRNWGSVISQFSKEYELMILECETAEAQDFVIGRVDTTSDDEVYFQHFSGAANWSESLARLPFKDLTSCQVDANYINVYQRHFERPAR